MTSSQQKIMRRWDNYENAMTIAQLDQRALMKHLYSQVAPYREPWWRWPLVKLGILRARRNISMAEFVEYLEGNMRSHCGITDCIRGFSKEERNNQ